MSESSELTRGKRGQGDPDAGITECGGMAGEPGAGESSVAGRLAALARPEEGSKASVWFPVLAERGTPGDTNRRLSLDLDVGQPLSRRSER